MTGERSELINSKLKTQNSKLNQSLPEAFTSR